MDINKIMRDYHKIIIFAGLCAGAISAIDATGIYAFDISEMHFIVHIVLFAAIIIAGYTYYKLFSTMRFRPKSPPQQPNRGQVQNLESLGNIEDIPQE